MKVYIFSTDGLVGRMSREFRDNGKGAGFCVITKQSIAIANEANLVGGENVGGTTTVSPAAPSEASDGDGDGDSEPEPKRRRGRPRNVRNAVPLAAENFDRLPDSALADIAVIRAVTNKSRATIYRWIAAGLFPKPKKLGLTSNNVWTVGDIRRALSA